MKNFNEIRTAIKTAQDKLELYDATERACDVYSFRFNESRTYEENAKIAEMSCRWGAAEMLKLAAHREKVLGYE